MEAAKKPQPFVKWAGGKRQLLPALKERMPERYGRYYEPFVGGGALLLEIGPDDAVINDINKVLIFAYRCIQSDPTELMAALSEIDCGCGEEPKEYYYYGVREAFNESIVEEVCGVRTAAMFVYLNKHCFNGLTRLTTPRRPSVALPCTRFCIVKKKYSFQFQA